MHTTNARMFTRRAAVTLGFAQHVQRRCLAVLAMAGLGLLSSGAAVAQTAFSSASNGLTCAADRTASSLNCNAGEFTTIVNMTTSPDSPTSCIAGSTISLSLIVSLSGTNANRYDGAIFVGEAANDPRTPGGQCSVARFPIVSTGNGFTSFDGDSCGDYIAAGVESWQINNVQVRCDGDPTTGLLRVPYLLSYQQNDPGVCNVDSSPLLAPGSPSKCNAGVASVPGLAVRGYVRVIKQTLPDGAADTFAFTASGPVAGAVSPTSFSLSDGQEQRVEMNIVTATRTLTISEGLTAGWESTASIVCTNPSGGAASYVTVNNATRTITANLNSTNFGAICTVTNTRQPRVRAVKRVSPTTDPGVFNLSVGATTVSNVGDGGSTAFTSFATGSSVAVAESAGTATNLAAYVSTYECIREDTGAVVASGSGTAFNIVPPAQQDTTCTFTNRRRNADLRITKTNTPGVNGDVDQTGDTVTSGATVAYVINATNVGPDAADGTVLTDPLPTNLSCGTATCTATGGAVCPAPTGAALVAALQGAGAVIPAMPANSTVTLTLNCTVP
jgi:trimeric autotransporter adhesin